MAILNKPGQLHAAFVVGDIHHKVRVLQNGLPPFADEIRCELRFPDQDNSGTTLAPGKPWPVSEMVDDLPPRPTVIALINPQGANIVSKEDVEPHPPIPRRL